MIVGNIIEYSSTIDEEGEEGEDGEDKKIEEERKMKEEEDIRKEEQVKRATKKVEEDKESLEVIWSIIQIVCNYCNQEGHMAYKYPAKNDL